MKCPQTPQRQNETQDQQQVNEITHPAQHPQRHASSHDPLTAGVETSTGPLGQGFANGVGMAIAERMAAERYNTAEHTLFDQTIFCLAGDGCLQEGVASEAIAFASCWNRARYDDLPSLLCGKTLIARRSCSLVCSAK